MTDTSNFEGCFLNSFSNNIKAFTTNFFKSTFDNTRTRNTDINDNIRFTNEHSDQIKDNLIKEAVHNGQRAAQAAAAASGTQLGAVKEINISGTSPSYSRAYGGMNLRAVKMEADAAPIESGTNTLSQTVNITYYLK